ncbi:hypothetical protein BOTBODRAFT_59477 [Botryobasidium botryosum FD-172 SS1]|uniref:Uncharacterized protein n=1 Tax=Botryobasidium botryosum (strain FD-172 SS1) TaxID=930990 RepID=A0A067M8U6_BOTB1|nr:hypothetical protein BOTBODRAFT_59477 [Botryobasidium botryosum FD-172 SS1]
MSDDRCSQREEEAWSVDGRRVVSVENRAKMELSTSRYPNRPDSAIGESVRTLCPSRQTSMPIKTPDKMVAEYRPLPYSLNLTCALQQNVRRLRNSAGKHSVLGTPLQTFWTGSSGCHINSRYGSGTCPAGASLSLICWLRRSVECAHVTFSCLPALVQVHQEEL